MPALKHAIKPGQLFGRLKVLRQKDTFAKDGHRRRSFICRCSCGREKNFTAQCLVFGYSKSCGCWRRDHAVKNLPLQQTHGCSGSPEYNAIKNIFQRCTNPQNPEYKNYGARGINVYPAWSDFFVFLAYLKSTIGLKPSRSHSIDRINNDLGYVPGNIRWATPKEQIANRRKIAMLEQFSTSELLRELERRKIKSADSTYADLPISRSP